MTGRPCTAFTLFFACKREGGRAKQRPGESTIQAALAQIPGAQLTHPECAALFDPLFGKPERG